MNLAIFTDNLTILPTYPGLLVAQGHTTLIHSSVRDAEFEVLLSQPFYDLINISAYFCFPKLVQF